MHKLAIGCMMLAASQAWAQAPQLRLQDADLHAQGGRITIERLPVTIGQQTAYRDIVIDLLVDAHGDIRVATDVKKPILSNPSPPPAPQHFAAGSYQFSDGNYARVARMGVDEATGAPEWQLTASGRAGFLDGAVWWEGPIYNHPLRRRLKDAGVTSQAFSYGRSLGGNAPAFAETALIGASQTGDVLELRSFRRGCCRDVKEAQQVLVLRRVGD